MRFSLLIISYLKLAQAQGTTFAEEGESCIPGKNIYCSQFGFFSDGNGMRRGLNCRSRADPNNFVNIDINETGVCRYVVSVGEACGTERMIEGKLIVPVCNFGNGRLTCQAGTCQNIAKLGEPCENYENPVANGPAYCAEGLRCVKPQGLVVGTCESMVTSTVGPTPTGTLSTTKPNPTNTVVSTPKPTVISSASSFTVLSLVGIMMVFNLYNI
jgi:hypothetical protein